MLFLTNEQRACFGLPSIEADWQRIDLPPSPYDSYCTYVYVTPDSKLKKVVLLGDDKFSEYGLDETISPDKIYLLPKTDKGKPVKLTAAALVKRTPVGMALCYERGYLSLSNESTQQYFYRSCYAGDQIESMTDLRAWIERWCTETDVQKLVDVQAFAARKKLHQRFKEGDFFRFRLNRALYGYGRVLLNYGEMRKQGIPFWDIFMGKPVLAGVYHIATERTDLSPAELAPLEMLPPQMIMDNIFFYGECEIIGNLPLDECRIDYPIHYGQSCDMRDPGLRYQCGRTYLRMDDQKELYDCFRNGAIGWSLDVKLPVLQACMKAGNNDPYWSQRDLYRAEEDLRNPKFKKELAEIRMQCEMKTQKFLFRRNRS